LARQLQRRFVPDTTLVFGLHLAMALGQRHDGNVMRTTKHSYLPIVLAGAAIVLALVATPAFAGVSKYTGIYSSTSPDADSPTDPAGPAFSVSLGADGTATVTQDPGKGAVTTFGHWSDTGSQVTVKFDAVDGKPTDPPMVFSPSHDGLQVVTWNHTLWGKETPPVLKKEESNWHNKGKHR
jgi:hypothetical protein